MSKDGMKTCPTCGEQIAASAKSCPNCGAKNKKPFFKRPIGIIIILVVVIGVIGSFAGSGGSNSDPAGSSDSASKEKKIEYTAYSVNEMMKDLDENAANADEKYRDKYVEISGKLGTIDSEGDYFDLMPTNDEFAVLGVTCNIQNDDQLAQIKKLKKGAKMTVRGQITDVGEVIAYSLDIDEIK